MERTAGGPPKTTREALRHFGLVENKVTKILHVFGIINTTASVSEIRRLYKRLELLIHPDRNGRIDRRGAERGMRVLGRAMDIVISEMEYDDVPVTREAESTFRIDRSLLFNVNETDTEYIVRMRRLEEQREEDRKTEQAAKEAREAEEEAAAEAARKKVEEDAAAEVATAFVNHVGDDHSVKAATAAAELADTHDVDAADIDAPDVESRDDVQMEGDQMEGDPPNYNDEWWEMCVDKADIENLDEKTDPLGLDEGADVEDDDIMKDMNYADYIVVESRDDERGEGEPTSSASHDVHPTATTDTTATETVEETNACDGGSPTNRRKEQRRKSKKRTMDRAKAQLQAEYMGSVTWIPRRCIRLVPEVGIQLATRWKCEQFIRAYTAYVGAHNGINLSLTLMKVRMSCKMDNCHATMVFDWQPRSGLWKLNKFVEHTNECGGQACTNDGLAQGAGPARACSPAYLPCQIARAVLAEEGTPDPNITSKHIARIINAKGVYSRKPSMAHYRSVRREVLRHMAASRAVDMASMQGYIDLLVSCGHRATLIVMTGVQMKATRLKAAKYIFDQKKKILAIPKEATFNEEAVDMSDIEDCGRYYGGFWFIPTVATQYCQYGRKTASADAAHCEGIGPQSYGTTFEVVTYDANNHLLPVFFGHFVGAECYEYWKTVFDAMKGIDGYDVAERTTIVDQEKSIDSAYTDAMAHAKLFLDPLHVKKNMSKQLGPEKASALSLYEQAVYAPCKAAVDSIICQYGENQKAYLGNFKKEQLYRAYSSLQDTVTCSQGAESQMSSSLRRHIRAVEPQKMLENIVLLQRTGFLNRQRAASIYTLPVPPGIEQVLANIILHSRQYQSSVQFVNGTNQMEAKVLSRTDAARFRHVFMPKDDNPQTAPRCCAYSTDGKGLPCWHGAAAIGEKHGYSNLYKFVERRHTSTAWKKVYENASFPIPTQIDVDALRTKAKLMIVRGESVQVPKALPPPRGRPTKTAGKRKQGFYERGPTAKRSRSYSCSLCGRDGHTKENCALRQLFS